MYRIRKNQLSPSLYLDRTGEWRPWKCAARFSTQEQAEAFAHKHGVYVFGLFTHKTFGDA
jgi:hypothetical protein